MNSRRDYPLPFDDCLPELLTDRQSDLLTNLIHVTVILNGSVTSTNIAEEALYLKEEGVAFSSQAKDELGNVFRHTSEMLFNSLEALLKRTLERPRGLESRPPWTNWKSNAGRVIWKG